LSRRVLADVPDDNGEFPEYDVLEKFFVFDVTVFLNVLRYLGEQFFFSSPKFCTSGS